MAQIYRFPEKKIKKLGYKKVRTKKKLEQEKLGQLNLFSGRTPVVKIPTKYTPFEEALIYDEKNDDRAIEYYLKAVAEKDFPADSYCNLGIIATRNEDIQKAFDYFSKALALDARHLEAHYNLANLYFEEGDVNLAKLHYQLALEIDPEFPNIHFNLGLVFMMIEDYDNAVASLRNFKLLVPPEKRKKADKLIKGLTGKR